MMPGKPATPPPSDLPIPLTTREQEVLALAARQYGDVRIAATLHIALRTVENHITHIYHKLELHNRGDAIAWAWKQGLVWRE